MIRERCCPSTINIEVSIIILSIYGRRDHLDNVTRRCDTINLGNAHEEALSAFTRGMTLVNLPFLPSG